MALHTKKRLILCCDGTWMDSDDGFQKPSLIPYVPTGTLQVPSNVTRISRALRKVGFDGTPQIIYYHAGVGTGSSLVDTITGGLLGTGISENIREVYSFIAANYVSGDDIVLIGFSRGAFTARSVAGMIRDIGILTREGMADFYPIFKDQENFKNQHYHDIFPTIPFPDKPAGDNRQREYRRRLERDGLTRLYDEQGDKIRIQAVAVWDTVGSLGIPTISWLAKLGLPHATTEYKFFDTGLYGCIRHAFQCLALDEHRAPFQATVWERAHHRGADVDLRQVWVPGAHSNAGGGYDDQEIANIALAWMMDQLASIGVSFEDEFIDKIFNANVQYYLDPPKKTNTSSGNPFRRPNKQWAVEPIYEKYKPVRPWALGKIWNSEVGMYRITGTGWRTPGFNTRADPDTGKKTDIPMTHTNERIHSSVRVRLELDGLGLDDVGPYKCHALMHKGWQLRQMRIKAEDPIPWDAAWPGAPAPEVRPDELRWVWEWDGPEDKAPLERIMVEERLGPYERKLLLLNRGAKALKSRRRKRRTRDSADPDAEKRGGLVQGDDGRGNINPAIVTPVALARDSSKAPRERRRRRQSPRSDEDSLADDRSPPTIEASKVRRRRGEGDRRSGKFDDGPAFIVPDRTRSRGGPPPPIYREEDAPLVQDRARSRAPSMGRPPPPPITPLPTSRTTPRPTSTDPSQRQYTLNDVIFTNNPGGGRSRSRAPPSTRRNSGAFEARRSGSGSGPQYQDMDDEIVVEEEVGREPRRRNRGYERRAYPVVEDISASVVDEGASRARAASRVRGVSRPPPPPPPPPPAGYRRERSPSASGIESSSGSDSGRDSGFDERDANLKGRKDRDREVHKIYQRRAGERRD